MPNPKKGAYFYYMLDFKRDQERRGVVFPKGLQDVQNAASDSWKAMSDSQKAKYKERVKEGLQNVKTKQVERMTSQGLLLSALQKNQREQQKGQNQITKHIDKILSDCYINNSLAERKFYFISVNYFVEMQNKYFVPAEIGICEFSLKDGVSNTYHSFINPGELPIGKAFPSQEHSDSTHKLPLPPNALGVTDLSKICLDVVDFIVNKEKKELYPVFCLDSHADPVKSVLNQFAMDINEEILFEVYPLEQLFFNLKQYTTKYAENTSPKDPFKNMFMARMALDRDPFEYKTKIACEKHEEMDNGKNCSLSVVIRWAYQIADYCCLDMAISMVPGEHGPWDMDPQFAPKPSRDIDIDDDDEFDNKSSVSYAAKSSVSFQSNLTVPKMELEKVKNEEYDEKFPSLGTIPHTTPAEFNPWKKRDSGSSTASVCSETQNMKLKDEEKNPWTIRNERKPRPPTEDSFSFSSIVSGRGRGIKAETEPEPQTRMTPNSSYGRGKRPKYE